jgi:hypothetical protein
MSPLAPSLTAQIAWHRTELARLERQQRQAQHDTIAAIVGPGVCFNARELFQHAAVSPELAALFVESNIRNPRQLGKRLKALGFTRVGGDMCGAIWLCE